MLPHNIKGGGHVATKHIGKVYYERKSEGPQGGGTLEPENYGKNDKRSEEGGGRKDPGKFSKSVEAGGGNSSGGSNTRQGTKEDTDDALRSPYA